MKWYQEPLRIVHNFPSGDITKFDAEAYAEEVRKLNANAVHYDATWEADYYARYDSRLVDKYSRLGKRDLLREVTAALHKRNIKIFVYVDGHPVAERIIEKHPDWAQVNSNGEKVKCYDVYYSGCVNSGWGEYKYEVMREIAAGYEIDGIFLDGPSFFENSCYCQNCRRKFKEQTGEVLPPQPQDAAISLRNKFLEWKYECIGKYVGRAAEVVHAARPDVVFYANATQGLHRLSKLSARCAQRAAPQEDILGMEAFVSVPKHKQLGQHLQLPGANAKYIRAIAEDKPRVIFTTYGLNPYYFLANCHDALETRIYQIFAHGAGVWLEMIHPVLNYSLAAARVVSKTYGFLGKNKAYYTKVKSLARVALLWSRRTGDYYDSHPQDLNAGGDFTSKGWTEKGIPPSHIYLTAFWGMYDALFRNHIPFDLIPDNALDNPECLNRYRVLILENTACLSAEQNRIIREYVAQGGGLIASYETSLYNETGIRQADFGLADLFGVHRRDDIIGPLTNSYVFCANQADPLLKKLGPLLPSPRFNMAVKTRKAVSAWLLANTSAQGFDQPARIQLAANQVVKDKPFLIANEYHKGKVVYMTGSIGDSFFECTFPAFKQLVRNAVAWAGKNSVPVEFDNLAETVEVALMHQPEQKRVLIHLVNLTGQMGAPLEGVIPLHDIKVRIRKKLLPAFAQIRLLRAERKVDFTDSNGVVEFILPTLRKYEVIVLQE